MTGQTVSPKETIHCNRCDEAFEAQKQMTRDYFCGQPAARIHDFTTCPHCQQTDGHWVFASDLMPTFEGKLIQQRKAQRKWMITN